MEKSRKKRKKEGKSPISDLLKIMAKIFYDIIPPKAEQQKTNRLRSSLLKIASLGLLVSMIWSGFSSVYKTIAYYNDTEKSEENTFAAGTLDFELSSTQVFSNIILSPGASATGSISVINMDNVPKYKIKAVNFSGSLCEYLDLEANLDGGAIEYSGKLKDIDFGPTVFESPDDWFFTLTLPASTTGDVIGETCSFNFVFYGSQTRNDLPFGQGFTDIEDATSSLKAKMCFDSETKSKGYWHAHLDIAKPYLPQMLGNYLVDSTSSAYKVLKTDYNVSMRNKLRGQLLAMKLNVAHFGMGEYIPASSTENVMQIIAAADELLKQDPLPPNGELEQMKNLLESLAQDLSIRVCTETGVKVIIPNGGEKWWVGRSYDLTWTTKNIDCPNDLVHISLWYSNDSGTTWGNVVPSTPDNGLYNWRVPLYLENNTYYTPSAKARLKVVAVCSENLMVVGWDISDYDFCPPIEKDLLTPEELTLAIALGLIEEDPVIEAPTSTEIQSDATNTDQTVIDGGVSSTQPTGGAVPEPVFSNQADQTAVSADQGNVTASDTQATNTQDDATSDQDPATTTEQVSTSTDQDSASQNPTTTDQVSTTTDQGGIIDAINSAIDNVVDQIVDVITSDDTAPATTTDDLPIATTTDPATVIQDPADQQQPAAIPEDTGAADPVPSDDGISGGDGTPS